MRETAVFFLENCEVRPFKQSRRKVRNIYLVKLHIITLNILGICPLVRKTKSSRIYASCLLGILILLSFISGFRSLLVIGYDGVFNKSLVALTITVLCCFFASILHSSWINRRTWEKLLEIVMTIDETEKNLLEVNVGKSSILEFTLLHLTPLCYSTFDGFLWLRADRFFLVDLPFFVSQHSGLFYEFQIAAFFWEIAQIINSRYELLEEQLDCILFARRMNDQNFQHSLELNIRKLKHKYKLLYNIVEGINIIFGWTVMILTIHVLLIFLFDFNLILNAEELKTELILEGFIFAVIIWILIVILVTACDKIERSGDNIIQHCYVLQENIRKSSASDELMLLVEYFKALAPKISACGLFNINRKLFSSFFSLLTSYVIISLQLRNPS